MHHRLFSTFLSGIQPDFKNKDDLLNDHVLAFRSYLPKKHILKVAKNPMILMKESW